MTQQLRRLVKRLQSFKSRRQGDSEDPLDKVQDQSVAFRAKYTSFQELLASNNELLNLIAEIEEKLSSGRMIGLALIRTLAERAVLHTMRMVQCLNFIAGQKYLALLLALGAIEKRIKADLGTSEHPPPPDLVLTYDRINRRMVDWVGGKSANLGEVRNQLEIAVPDGFAITTGAFHAFVAHNRLDAAIQKQLSHVDPQQMATIASASAAIQACFQAARLPEELKKAMAEAHDRLRTRQQKRAHGGALPPLAMRSSAIGEDSELSFAGQYRSVLNVPDHQIGDTYRLIAASLYTDRAILYRLSQGIRDADIAMGVACLEMVTAQASGVAYSQDPLDRRCTEVVINGIWGLGSYLVEGVVTPDSFRVTRDASGWVIQTHVARKETQLILQPHAGVAAVRVPPDLILKPCLAAHQVETLADYAVRLAAHFGCPQDIEWALDSRGKLVVLQSRPLRLAAVLPEAAAMGSAGVPGQRVLINAGVVASAGVGMGPVYQVRADEDLLAFPEGAVLVARHSSPSYVMVMPKARAIVTQSGSVTGHMASLAREFQVPAILGAPHATRVLEQGQVVTVDANAGIIYAGRVEALLADLSRPTAGIHDTPVYRTLRKVADKIVPLNLTDPKAPAFRAENCRTLHDIMRMVHELCYQEMFQLSDHLSYERGAAVKLDALLPIDLYMIDLGGGLDVAMVKTMKKVTQKAITSLPLKALLRGMAHPALVHCAGRPFELSGFLSVMRQQLLAPPTVGDRFGERSYAIISDKYLNFSSRVGYHYSILDAYCGLTANKNYITFSFKGGAADDARRHRRARAIAQILESLDFTVDVQGDRVDARLLKYEQAVVEEKLDLLGRLLQYTRQMDMLMKSDDTIAAVVTCFLAGDYRLTPQYLGRRANKALANGRQP